MQNSHVMTICTQKKNRKDMQKKLVEMQNSHMMPKDEVALVVDGDGPLKYLTEESSEIETENTKDFA